MKKAILLLAFFGVATEALRDKAILADEDNAGQGGKFDTNKFLKDFEIKGEANPAKFSKFKPQPPKLERPAFVPKFKPPQLKPKMPNFNDIVKKQQTSLKKAMGKAPNIRVKSLPKKAMWSNPMEIAKPKKAAPPKFVRKPVAPKALKGDEKTADQSDKAKAMAALFAGFKGKPEPSKIAAVGADKTEEKLEKKDVPPELSPKAKQMAEIFAAMTSGKKPDTFSPKTLGGVSKKLPGSDLAAAICNFGKDLIYEMGSCGKNGMRDFSRGIGSGSILRSTKGSSLLEEGDEAGDEAGDEGRPLPTFSISNRNAKKDTSTPPLTSMSNSATKVLQLVESMITRELKVPTCYAYQAMNKFCNDALSTWDQDLLDRLINALFGVDINHGRTAEEQAAIDNEAIDAAQEGKDKAFDKVASKLGSSRASVAKAAADAEAEEEEADEDTMILQALAAAEDIKDNAAKALMKDGKEITDFTSYNQYTAVAKAKADKANAEAVIQKAREIMALKVEEESEYSDDVAEAADAMAEAESKNPVRFVSAKKVASPAEQEAAADDIAIPLVAPKKVTSSLFKNGGAFDFDGGADAFQDRMKAPPAKPVSAQIAAAAKIGLQVKKAIRGEDVETDKPLLKGGKPVLEVVKDAKGKAVFNEKKELVRKPAMQKQHIDGLNDLLAKMFGPSQKAKAKSLQSVTKSALDKAKNAAKDWAVKARGFDAKKQGKFDNIFNVKGFLTAKKPKW